MKSSKIRIALLCVGVAVASSTAYWLGTQRLQPAQAVSAAAPNARVVLYYRNPMGLPDTSPVPKKDSMGMDYVPVYADDEAAAVHVGQRRDVAQQVLALPAGNVVPQIAPAFPLEALVFLRKALAQQMLKLLRVHGRLTLPPVRRESAGS